MRQQSIIDRLNTLNHGKMIIACADDIFDSDYLGMWDRAYWPSRLRGGASFYLDTFERLLKNTNFAEQTAKDIFNVLSTRLDKRGHTLGGVLAKAERKRYDALREITRRVLKPADNVRRLVA